MNYLAAIIKQAAGAIFLSVYAASVMASNEIAEAFEMTVYKSPSCGCCQKWVEHINNNNFQSSIVEMSDLSSIKSRFGIQGKYRSCHTGVVTVASEQEAASYVFEGHVPAEFVSQFLANPPVGAIGLSVPGMPVGSPGMEVGDRKDYYQVLLLNEDGSSSVFAEVNRQTQ